MHHAIFCFEVGYCYFGIVDEYAIVVDGNFHFEIGKQRSNLLTIAQIGGFGLGANHMVEQNVGQVAGWVGKQRG